MALTRFSFEADGLTIVGEGVVEIHGAPPADPGAVIVEFLDGLDPATLEQEALERLGWGDTGPGAQTAKVIEILREIITGKEDP